MRKIILIVLVALIGFAFLNQKQLASYAYTSICDHPISYRIGEIDERFNITETELLNYVESAANIWREEAKRPLFVYEPDGLLEINMDYDGRQTLSEGISDLEKDLNEEKENMSPQEAEYDRLSASYETKLAAFNEQVEYWNNRGGAPEDEYKKLSEEQKNLSNEAGRLNEIAKSLNRAARQYNSQVEQLNKSVDTFNSALKVRPEEGLYSGDNVITLYFNRGETPLVHTLAHELGHALGMGHVENQNAIMFSQTNDLIELTSEDIDQLNKACEKQFIGTILQKRLVQLVQRLKQ